MIKFLSGAVLLLSVQTSTAEPMKADVPVSDIRQSAGTLTVGDLAVGEAGLAEGRICIDGDNLLMPDSTPVYSERNAFSANFRVRKEPGGGVRIDVFFGESAKRKSLSDALSESILSSIDNYNCALAKLTGVKMEPINNINGETSLKAILSED